MSVDTGSSASVKGFREVLSGDIVGDSQACADDLTRFAWEGLGRYGWCTESVVSHQKDLAYGHQDLHRQSL